MLQSGRPQLWGITGGGKSLGNDWMASNKTNIIVVIGRSIKKIGIY